MHNYFGRVYHFNYFGYVNIYSSDIMSVNGQKYTGGSWSSTSPFQLRAWNSDIYHRFVAWSIEIVMNAGDKFRTVNSGVSSQQLSGYFVGAEPLGSQANIGPANVTTGSNMLASGSYTKEYDFTGSCSSAGFTGAGYTAPLAGLYQLQVRTPLSSSCGGVPARRSRLH
jgi:hypothetical protein